MSDGLVKGQKYYGKYRGTVFNNIDPQNIGRIQAIVPDVLGLIPSSWAMPCMPFAGIQNGVYAVPQFGAGVWIEFEQGDPDYPIWTGCYWGSMAEVPAPFLLTPPALQQIVMQTVGQNSLVITDMAGPTGGIILKTRTGAFISINETGITLSNGQGAMIQMTGPTVTINLGALTVI